MKKRKVIFYFFYKTAAKSRGKYRISPDLRYLVTGGPDSTEEEDHEKMLGTADLPSNYYAHPQTITAT